MFAFGCPDIILVMKIWLQLLIIGSFFFGFIGLNAGHHHPDLVHDGDELRYFYIRLEMLLEINSHIYCNFIERIWTGASIQWIR